MDDASQHAREVLEALAGSNEQLIDLARIVRSRPGVVGLRHEMGLRAYQTGPMMEAYVEAELGNGTTLTWQLDVRWDHTRWQIESSIATNDDDGHHILRGFPERTATTLSEFVKQLEAATGELLAAADDLDLLLNRDVTV